MGSFHTFPALILIVATFGCSSKSESEKLTELLGSWDAFDQQLKQQEDPKTRDLILLKLVVNNAEFAPQLCKRLRSEGALEKCQQVAGRPHLKDAR